MKCILISVFIILFSTSFTSAQGFLKAQGKTIVNEKGDEVILRGMGLGGWMLQEGYMLRVNGIGQQQHVIRGKLEELIGKSKTDEFYNAWLANHTRKVDIDSMARWGFNSVRLPMHYNLFTLPIDRELVAGENTWLDKGFEMTDNLLKWCKANNMYLILDLHAAPGGQGNDNNISDRDPSKSSLWQSEGNQKKMIALWRKLAERYANEPWIGAYDIINEPNWGFQNENDRNGCGEQMNAPLRKLMMDITQAIRELDKKHIIIVEGNCWGNNYNGIFPLWDNNMLISFHKYWNYNDKNSIQKFIDIREQQQTPVWLGESGENSNLWFRDAIQLMESNKIGWAWWPLKKLGFNNPLELKVPSGYQRILDFWSAKGPQPSSDEAYKAVMELAENLKLENCIYHQDVVDAMFRQVRSNETRPFKSHVLKEKLEILAADFDLGRNRYAYFDRDTGNYYISTGGPRTSGNKGHTYRNDGVDIEVDRTGPFVTNTEDGEWLQYTLTSTSKKKFKSLVNVSPEQSAGKIMMIVNGVPMPAVDIPHTNGEWKPVDVGDIPLVKGKNVIRLNIIKGQFKLRSISFTTR